MNRSISVLIALWIAVVVAVTGCEPPPGDEGSGELQCGAGTHQVDGVCLPGADSTGGLTCGPGTHADNGYCVLDTDGNGVVCGTGTHQEGNHCVPDPFDAGVTCGVGTHLEYGQCVRDPGDPGNSCGPGTHQSGTQCVPNPVDPPLTCGPGTHESGNVCLPDDTDAGPFCGAGTHPVDGACVPNGASSYELRIAETTISANGYSGVTILAIGTYEDGTPSLERVVFNTSRAGAGTFSPVAPTLGPLGATSTFVPCSASTPGCVGPVDLLLALASAPTEPVARVTVELVAPPNVGSTSPCLGGGNVLYFDGNDYIFNGKQTVTVANWSAYATTMGLSVYVTPADPIQGSSWSVGFATTQLGQPIMESVYEEAQREPFASPGHPGMDISGSGRGCNIIAGRFQIQKLVTAGSVLRELTATFEQHCEGGAAVLKGCVHFAQ